MSLGEIHCFIRVVHHYWLCKFILYILSACVCVFVCMWWRTSICTFFFSGGICVDLWVLSSIEILHPVDNGLMVNKWGINHQMWQGKRIGVMIADRDQPMDLGYPVSKRRSLIDLTQGTRHHWMGQIHLPVRDVIYESCHLCGWW